MKYKKLEIYVGDRISELNSHKGLTYSGKELHAMANDCESFDYPLIAMDLSFLPWRGSMESLEDFLSHLRRVDEADLSYPIILSPDGCILDGYHRICKAVLLGKLTIKAVRLSRMPISTININQG